MKLNLNEITLLLQSMEQTTDPNDYEGSVLLQRLRKARVNVAKKHHGIDMQDNTE